MMRTIYACLIAMTMIAGSVFAAGYSKANSYKTQMCIEMPFGQD